MKQNINTKQHGHGSMHDLSANGEIPRELEPPLEERIEDLRHRLRIEAAVVEGAKNVIKLLERGNKDKGDKKALQEVRNMVYYNVMAVFQVFYKVCFPSYLRCTSLSKSFLRKKVLDHVAIIFFALSTCLR